MTVYTEQSRSVSIIIAVKELNDNLRVCLEHCLNLDYPDFEIIVFPDEPFQFPDSRVKVVPTGSLSPPRKRDLALSYAHGEIFAFIDDDAYPDRDWLKNAVKNFQDEQVGAVCGPAITAPNEPSRQIASGMVYESLLISGDQLFRFKPLSKCKVDDYPTCNLLVRFEVMRQLGGFNTDFWPGEDTFLCSGITDKLNKDIIYDPQVLVYHQRRPLFLPHLKQVASYGLHRGYFVKRGFRSSLRISYFLPSLLLLWAVGGLFAVFFLPVFRPVYVAASIIYLLLVAIFSLPGKPVLMGLKFLGIIATHFTYGFFFFVGLLSRRMKEEHL